VGLRDAERIQQLEEIRGHLLERVGTRGNVGGPVPSHVVAQHAIALGQRRRMVVPQGEGGAQGMRQGQHGGARRTFEAVVGPHDVLSVTGSGA